MPPVGPAAAAGDVAGKAGKPRKSNPYPLGTPASDSWFQTYDAAQAKNRDKVGKGPAADPAHALPRRGRGRGAMIVLALDIATATGAAWDGPNGAPQFCTYRLPSYYSSEDLGARLHKFQNWLYDLAGMVKPGLIAVEAPLVDTGRPDLPTNKDAARLLIALASQAHLVGYCLDPKARVIEKNVSAVKRHLTGTGHAKKDAIMAACRRLGWAVKTDHEGDACSLWALVKAETDPQFSYKTTPLWGEAEELARRETAARNGTP